MAYEHRIEYHRSGSGDELVLEHTETVEDHGWYIRKEDDWQAYYTLECAKEYLHLVEARPGRYAVAVWRGKTRVCTVGLDWFPTVG